MNVADLEISLRALDVSSYAVDARCTLSNGDGDVRLPAGQHLAPLDLTGLLQLSLDQSAYGQALSAELFADADVRSLFAQAIAQAETKHVPLRVRLLIDANVSNLHALRWELLRNPLDGELLCTSERILFSRYLQSQDFRAIPDKTPSKLRALVVIANPSNLDAYQLSTFSTQSEDERVSVALSPMAISRLTTNGQASLNNLAKHLRDGCDVLYLMAHGALIDNRPHLWLEQADGTANVVDGNEIVTRLSELQEPPRLVVLASCQSARMEMTDEGVLAALGPRLAASGVAAVVAMQGNITLRTLDTFLPTLFSELQRDGVIDRAMAVSRGAVRDKPDAWMPVLFMRLRSGSLWHEAVAGVTVEQWQGANIGAGVITARNIAGRDIIYNIYTSSVDKAAPVPSEPPADKGPHAAVNKTVLRNVMVDRFTNEELETLCADVQQLLNDNSISLQVNLDIVGGSSKAGKILNLIDYLDRRGYVDYLVRTVREARPGAI